MGQQHIIAVSWFGLVFHIIVVDWFGIPGILFYIIVVGWFGLVWFGIPYHSGGGCSSHVMGWLGIFMPVKWWVGTLQWPP